MREPLFSVVIPTYDRVDVLQEVVQALEAQQEAPPFEIVIVDDGSRDGTADFLDSLSERSGRTIFKVLRQENQGPARARNRGVEAATGAWVAFLGDDTVPCQGWLAEHHRAQTSPRAEALRERGLEVGVLGYTRWHPRMRLTPFLRYINEHGLQFGYALIDDPDRVPFNFFYTSNLSLSRRALVAEPFDLGFPDAAWEDIELSYRLEKLGFRLLYRSAAEVAHDHPTNLERFADRQRKAGRNAVVFHRRHPELGPFLGLSEHGPPPLPGRQLQLGLETLARALQILPLRLPSLWERVLRYHYIQGLHEGWQTHQVAAKGEKA